MNRPKTIPTGILAAAGLALFGGAIVQAEMPAVPPPNIGTEELTIPKAMIRAYLSQVHPSYLRWLANGDGGAEDSLAAFELYLSMQPVNRFETWCYTQLYIRSH